MSKSPKFQRLLPLLEQVPGRSGIRFHRGTKPEHSKGCILVNSADEQRLTARWLAEQTAREETRLEICNYTNLNVGMIEENKKTLMIDEIRVNQKRGSMILPIQM